MSKKKEVTKKERRFHEELIIQLVALSTAGFGFVAALAWNEAIKAFMTEYIIPQIPGSGVISSIIYALLVTGIEVLVTFQLSRLASRFQR